MKITLTNSKIISGLIEELQKDFPNNIPINNDIDLLEVRRLQGQQEVIQWIKNLLDAGEETEDEG